MGLKIDFQKICLLCAAVGFFLIFNAPEKAQGSSYQYYDGGEIYHNDANDADGDWDVEWGEWWYDWYWAYSSDAWVEDHEYFTDKTCSCGAASNTYVYVIGMSDQKTVNTWSAYATVEHKWVWDGPPGTAPGLTCDYYWKAGVAGALTAGYTYSYAGSAATYGYSSSGSGLSIYEGEEIYEPNLLAEVGLSASVVGGGYHPNPVTYASAYVDPELSGDGADADWDTWETGGEQHYSAEAGAWTNEDVFHHGWVYIHEGSPAILCTAGATCYTMSFAYASSPQWAYEAEASQGADGSNNSGASIRTKFEITPWDY